MKVNQIMKEMYAACLSGDTMKGKILWLKAIKKSLKKKKTHAIR